MGRDLLPWVESLFSERGKKQVCQKKGRRMTLRASPPTLTVVRAATVAPLAAAAPTGPRATSHITLAGRGGLASASSKLRSIRLNAHSTAFPVWHETSRQGRANPQPLGGPGRARCDEGPPQAQRAVTWSGRGSRDPCAGAPYEVELRGTRPTCTHSRGCRYKPRALRSWDLPPSCSPLFQPPIPSEKT